MTRGERAPVRPMYSGIRLAIVAQGAGEVLAGGPLTMTRSVAGGAEVWIAD